MKPPSDHRRCKAVIAYHGNHGVVLYASGEYLELDLIEVGTHTSDLGLDDGLILAVGKPGIVVFEGEQELDGEEISYDGIWRVPTVEEWSSLQRGESPWPRRLCSNCHHPWCGNAMHLPAHWCEEKRLCNEPTAAFSSREGGVCGLKATWCYVDSSMPWPGPKCDECRDRMIDFDGVLADKFERIGVDPLPDT